MRPHALCGLFACALVACGQPVDGAAWRFRFADAELAARALVVRTEIRVGGCAGPSAFVTRVALGTNGDTPPELSPGRYGFYGRARDANCVWFADGCAEADLPASSSIEVVLDRSFSDILDPGCVPGERSEDPASVDSNGGSSSATSGGSGTATSGGAEQENGGSGASGGEPDAGATIETDASVVTFDPSAPKCTSLDSQVVACYDFDGSLSDASSSQNDVGPAANASFEAAQSGQALRVDGKTLAVSDSASLNVSALTIELWLRADGLVNLDGQTNDNSLLLDKDQQYNVGFNAQGALRMEVYRGINDAETTTAEPALLSVGELAYAAFVYDGSSSRIYLDGVLMDSEVVGFPLFQGNGGAMHIGSGSPSTSRPFDGLIDALRISKVARSDAELCAAAGKQLTSGQCR